MGLNTREYGLSRGTLNSLALLSFGTARQVLEMNSGATGAQWSSNLDLPGTLDVTGVVTLDASLSVATTTVLTGAVGIGGATTSRKLQVYGNVGLSGSAAPTLSLITNDTGEATIDFVNVTGDQEWYFRMFDSGTKRIAIYERLPANTERFSIATGGAATITGTLAVSGRLSTASVLAIAATSKFYLDGVAATGDTYMHEASANVLSFVANGNTMLNVVTDGIQANKITTIGGDLTLRTSGGTQAVLSNSTGIFTLGDVGITMLKHTGTTAGFYNTTPIIKQTGVAVTAAGIHAALVNLGLIAA